jgi:hypothetical protein
MQCTGGRQLRLQIQRDGNYRILMPENIDFIKADLRKDPSEDIVKGECDHHNESEN